MAIDGHSSAQSIVVGTVYRFTAVSPIAPHTTCSTQQYYQTEQYNLQYVVRHQVHPSSCVIVARQCVRDVSWSRDTTYLASRKNSVSRGHLLIVNIYGGFVLGA